MEVLRTKNLPLKPDLYIGTLSGTSVDGIDVALVHFGPRPELRATHSLAIPDDLRGELLKLGVPGDNEIDRLGQADVRLGRLFAQAVHELLAKAALAPRDIAAIGSHGQTVRHRPGQENAFSLQIGDPNVMATLTGIPVVADFRRKDVALGGQGAPLVPAFHQAVFQAAGTDRVVVNIGGIANLSVLSGGADNVLGFDTGPGNTLLDGWCRKVLGAPMDRDGQLAAQGRLKPDLLAAMLRDPYFQQAPPKSTGPEYFSAAWLQLHLAACGAIAAADVQATLVALTAQSIAQAIKSLKGMTRPDVFVCGGGAHNPALMRALADGLAGGSVRPTDALGIPADWVEAMAFAWLARQRLLGLPGNCPAVTGASRPAVLGGLWLPA
jgi:anhydro-N-acetylmuramic acid kinase